VFFIWPEEVMMREPAGLGTKLLISLTRPRGGVFGDSGPII
jgi:hypothetical protein